MMKSCASAVTWPVHNLRSRGLIVFHAKSRHVSEPEPGRAAGVGVGASDAPWTALSAVCAACALTIASKSSASFCFTSPSISEASSRHSSDSSSFSS